MTDGPKQGGDDSPRSNDRQESGPIGHEDLPDILEIFGSDPLVKGPAGPATEMAPGDGVAWPTPDRPQSKGAQASQDDEVDDQDDQLDDEVDDDSIWDPMASPRDDGAETAPAESSEFASRPAGGRSGPPAGDSATTIATERRLGEMRDILQLNEDRLGRLEATIQDLSKQTNFLPPKLRGLGKKVDELSTSVGDTRLRSLLADVVGLGDLIEGALRAMPEREQQSQERDEHRFFHAMATRLSQILDSYDLQVIPTDAGFDPTVHNAIDVEPVADEALDGQIIDVVRRGYRGEHSVLRYAEVTVGRYTANPKPEPEPEAALEAVPEAALAPAIQETKFSEAPTTPEPSEVSRTVPDDSISATYAPFLGASGTAEDSKNLTKRGTRRPTERNETTDDQVDSERGVEPPSA